MNKSLMSTILCNKVFLYLASRYIVYAIQFIALLLIANRLGPYQYGRWGFFILICGYFMIVNFGLPHSLNVLLVQNKKNEIQTKDYIQSSYAAVGILSLVVVILALLYSIHPLAVFLKYDVGRLFYLICLFAVLFYFNSIFNTIYRIKNRLLEIAVNQSLIPFFILLAALFFSGEVLFRVLVVAYLVAQIAAFLMFVFRGAIPFDGHIRNSFVTTIFNKGFFLFLYNSCFYLILTTTSTIISYSYSVEEYGLYSFSYSLGHSVLLLLEAFTFIIFPKIIDKLYTGSIEEVKDVLSSVRINYVVSSHGLMYIAFAFFPLFIMLFPKYQLALPSLCLTALAVLLSTNSFGYNAYLIAKNDEKFMAFISIISLIVNIVIGVFIVWLELPFYYVVICMMCSYLLFAFMCSLRATKKIGIDSSIIRIFDYVIPIRLMIPFACGLCIVVFQMYTFSFVPILLFGFLNISSISKVLSTIRTVLIKPDIVDLK